MGVVAALSSAAAKEYSGSDLMLAVGPAFTIRTFVWKSKCVSGEDGRLALASVGLLVCRNAMLACAEGTGGDSAENIGVDASVGIARKFKGVFGVGWYVSGAGSGLQAEALRLMTLLLPLGFLRGTSRGLMSTPPHSAARITAARSARDGILTAAFPAA